MQYRTKDMGKGQIGYFDDDQSPENQTEDGFVALFQPYDIGGGKLSAYDGSITLVTKKDATPEQLDALVGGMMLFHETHWDTLA